MLVLVNTVNATLTTIAVDCGTATNVSFGFDQYFNNLTPVLIMGLLKLVMMVRPGFNLDSISADTGSWHTQSMILLQLLPVNLLYMPDGLIMMLLLGLGIGQLIM